MCMRGSRGGGGQGVRIPFEKSQTYRFLSNAGPDPLTNIKLPSKHSMLGHHRHASETPFKWRFAGGPMMDHLKWYLGPPTPLQLQKKEKKNVDKKFWIRA